VTSARIAAFAAVMVLSACSPASDKTAPPAAKPAAAAEPVEKAPVTEHFDVASKITGMTYLVFVSRPSAPAVKPKTGWPVLYVLDGNMFFETAAQAAWLNVSGGANPALVVGIGYPSDEMPRAELLRNADLLPAIPADMQKQLVAALPPGTAIGKGAEAFYRFLTEELQPELAKKYAVDTADTTLWGHSLGGLFVVETLFKHPAAFKNYVASSPSLWFDDRKVLAGEPGFVEAVKTAKAHPCVLVSVGENEQKPFPADVPLPAAMAGMSHEDFNRENLKTRMVDNARELADQLAKVDGATVEFRLYKDEGHLSAIPGSLSRAVTFSQGGSHY
jgi:predicted alpha/beta superfamily hydrolase